MTPQKAREMILTYVFLLTLLLQGCMAAPADVVAGGILELQPGATFSGLKSAVTGAFETGIWKMPGQSFYLFGWRQGEIGYGLTCMNCQARNPLELWRFITGGKGMVLSGENFGGVVRYLESRGWYPLTPDKLPPAITAIIAGARAAAGIYVGIETGIVITPNLPFEEMQKMFGPMEVMQ